MLSFVTYCRNSLSMRALLSVNQEQQRYNQPHKAFTFRMHGFESIVGPVKGVFDKEMSLNKAREHTLLRSDRPPYVTILSLGQNLCCIFNQLRENKSRFWPAASLIYSARCRGQVTQRWRNESRDLWTLERFTVPGSRCHKCTGWTYLTLVYSAAPSGWLVFVQLCHDFMLYPILTCRLFCCYNHLVVFLRN